MQTKLHLFLHQCKLSVSYFSKCSFTTHRKNAIILFKNDECNSSFSCLMIYHLDLSILIIFCLSCKLKVPNERRNQLSKTQQFDSETPRLPPYETEHALLFRF